MSRMAHVKIWEIQAPTITAIVNRFIEGFGKEKVLKVLTEVIKKDSIKELVII